MALECSNKTPGPESNKHVHLCRAFHHASAFTAYLLQPGYRVEDLYDRAQQRLLPIHPDSPAVSGSLPRLLASIASAKTMNSVGKAAYIQWAEEQSRLLDSGDSDSSSSPLAVKHTAAQRGLPGSPRRNGMVLDASVRSIFSMRAACSPHNHRQNPDKYQICGVSHLPLNCPEHVG
jgi:hypothetical protein